MKVAVLGLDALDPRVLARHLPSLPTFRRLLDASIYGRMRSCHPPITVPAWAVMASGRDPGEIGLTGFRNRKPGAYDAERTASAQAVRVPRVWDLAGTAGRRVIVHGVPPSWPPPVVNGLLTSCFLAPSTDDGWTWPPKLAEELEAGVGEIWLDVPDYRRADRESLRADLRRFAAQRWDIAERLLSLDPDWDLFWMVDMSTDRLAHGFLDDEAAVAEHLGYLDGRLSRLLALLPHDAAVILASDHGAQPLAGSFAVNEWLVREGLLALREAPAGPTPFEPALVDWSRTTAWALGGHYGRIFLNVQGREPEGIVAPLEAPRVAADIARRLRAVALPDGTPLGNVVLTRDEAWTGPHLAEAPDLLLYAGNLAWRATGAVGRDSVFHTDPEVGADVANHDWHGVFALRAPGVEVGVQDVDIVDVAPTVMDLLGLGRAEGMRGRSWVTRMRGEEGNRMTQS